MTNPIKTQWESCYDDSWQDLIVPDAFAHPAKMARGLLARILRHAAAEGWIGLGAVILDPFGGIGSTGILGAYEGYCVVCCELEPKFVDLAKKNFALHAKKLERLGCPQPIMIQGDSRELCRIVAEADCIVSSPPYAGSEVTLAQQKGCFGNPENMKAHTQARDKIGRRYGQTPGQLGAMKPGSADAVISSPPYAETLKGDGTQKETAAESHAKRSDPKAGGPLGQSQRTQGYGSTGNLGNLKAGDVKAIISSPPYEKAHAPNTSESDVLNKDRKDLRKWAWNQTQQGETPGQLSNDKGDTFWSAAKLIVRQCHQILKPGGVAIWVVKAFVRNKKIVDFPGDWRRLCESIGFKTICEHHAMLVKETTGADLFGNKGKVKGRKSFFRRLSETKAAYDKYWPTLDEHIRKQWRYEAVVKLWAEYEVADKKPPVIPDENTSPGKRQILNRAKAMAFVASGERVENWNAHVRIDFEKVLCMKKET